MIDLHLHLDGSLSAALVRELAQAQRYPLPDDLEKALAAPEDCADLNEYLRCFDLPLALLQSAGSLEQAAYTLCTGLREQGLLYAEVRFAPQLHTNAGLTQRQAVEAVCKGAARSGFPAQIILCCMRGGADPANRETIDTAANYLGHGVCACDLAGAEALYPTTQYQGLFAYARSLQIPFTLHAGEADGPASIRAALEMGAARIGHGVRAGEDPALLELLSARQIPLELCCTSNLQTKAVPTLQAFPLRSYLHRGLCCTVNTDNTTVSRTTLRAEYTKLQAQGLTREETKTLLLNACRSAFLPEAERTQLAGKMKENWEPWLPPQAGA